MLTRDSATSRCRAALYWKGRELHTSFVRLMSLEKSATTSQKCSDDSVPYILKAKAPSWVSRSIAGGVWKHWEMAQSRALAEYAPPILAKSMGVFYMSVS
jgi:hypothetical protein